MTIEDYPVTPWRDCSPASAGRGMRSLLGVKNLYLQPIKILIGCLEYLNCLINRLILEERRYGRHS
jgi:hypothetical protein